MDINPNSTLKIEVDDFLPNPPLGLWSFCGRPNFIFDCSFGLTISLGRKNFSSNYFESKSKHKPEEERPC